MIFYNSSQNESVILKVESCTSYRNKRNTQVLHDCKDIGGFLKVALVWIHPIHQNLCRTQLPRVGNNIDSRDNRFNYCLRDVAPVNILTNTSKAELLKYSTRC